MNDMYMEDVRDLTVDVSDLVESRLKHFKISLTNDQEDDIHNKVWEVLEKVSNGDYKNHM